MNEQVDDMRNHMRFLNQIEHAIRGANREIIAKEIPSLDRESFYRLAITVAKLRAKYLNVALAMDWHENADSVAVVRRHREIFQEASKGFEALQRAIERGYVDIS